MRKFFAGVLCAVLAFSTATVSASAVDELVNSENTSSVGQKEKIISALLSNESEWLDYSEGGTKTIQFIDLDFDGNLEFVTERSTTGNNLYTNIFNLREGDYDGFVRTSGEYEQTVSPSGLVGYYDKEKSEYRMIGASYVNLGIALGDSVYNYEVSVSRDYDKRKFVNKSIASYTSVDDKNTYYDANGNVISESDYNNICNDYVKGLINVNMKFDSFTIQDENGIKYYDNLTEAEKRAKLEELYDSFTYDKYDIVEPDPEPTPEPTPKPTPSSSSTGSTPTSPKTGVQTNFGVMFSAILVSGAAIVVAGRKRKEDI